VKLVYKIVADCDLPPDSSYDPRTDADVLDGLDELEDTVATALVGAGAGFAIEATVTVEV
jgi:hypothetical protein